MLGGPDDLELTGASTPPTTRSVSIRNRLAGIRNMPAIVVDAKERDRIFTGWDLPNYEEIQSRAPNRGQADIGAQPIGP
ncbi:MAG: hypothetical protein ACF8NJ_09080 [Phycisphaerales bacterium JB038]